MKTIEDSIEILTKMFIKDHIDKKDTAKLVMTKKDLYQFCIELIKVLEENYYEDN